jgi:hypothetical protein
VLQLAVAALPERHQIPRMPMPAAASPPPEPAQPPPPPRPAPAPLPREIGGPPGPEPTRYGDWQYNGRCTDF